MKKNSDSDPGRPDLFQSFEFGYDKDHTQEKVNDRVHILLPSSAWGCFFFFFFCVTVVFHAERRADYCRQQRNKIIKSSLKVSFTVFLLFEVWVCRRSIWDSLDSYLYSAHWCSSCRLNQSSRVREHGRGQRSGDRKSLCLSSGGENKTENLETAYGIYFCKKGSAKWQGADN